MTGTITCKYGGEVYDITDYVNEYASQYEASEQFLIGNAPAEEITLKIDTSQMNQATVLACRKAELYTIKNKSYYIYNAPTSWTGLVSLTLYDKMMQMNEKFLTAPWSEYASRIVSGICERYGTRNNSNINGYDKIIASKSDTARQVIGKIAGMYGMNAFVTSGDVLTFREIGRTTNALPFAYDYSIKETRSIGKVSWTNGNKKYEKSINGRWLYTLPASIDGSTLKSITYNGKSYTAGDELELFNDADIMIERDTDGNTETGTTAQDDNKNGYITLKQAESRGYIDADAFEEYFSRMRYADYITAGEAEAATNDALAAIDSNAFAITVKNEKGEELWKTHTYRKDGKEWYRMPEIFRTFRAIEYESSGTKFTPGTVAEIEKDTVLTLRKADIRAFYVISFRKTDGTEIARYSIHAYYDNQASAYFASYELGETVGGLYIESYEDDGIKYKSGDTIRTAKDVSVTVTLKDFSYLVKYSNILTEKEAGTDTATGEGVKTVSYTFPNSVGGYTARRYIGEDGTIYKPGDAISISGDTAFSARLVTVDDRYCAVYLINCKSGKAEHVDALTRTDSNLSTMYIDGANEYITQERIDAIMKKYAGLEFSTFTTLKGQKPTDGDNFMPGDLVTYDGISFMPQKIKTTVYQINAPKRMSIMRLAAAVYSDNDIYDSVEMSNDMTLSGTEDTTGTGSLANNYITQRKDFIADNIPACSISYDKLDDGLTDVIDGAKRAVEGMEFIKVKRKKLTLSVQFGSMVSALVQSVVIDCNAISPDENYKRVPKIVSLQPCGVFDYTIKAGGESYTIASIHINDTAYGVQATTGIGNAILIKDGGISSGLTVSPSNSVDWWMYYTETDETEL